MRLIEVRQILFQRLLGGREDSLDVLTESHRAHAGGVFCLVTV